MLSFAVKGTPIPQGSKTGRVVGRRIRLADGQVAVVGAQVVLTEISDMQTKTKPSNRLKRWRKAIAAEAKLAMSGAELWTGPVVLTCEFVLPRPSSHWTKSGRLTKSAPRAPTGKPDTNKLTRAVEDALTGVVYEDDAQVVWYGDVGGSLRHRKRYARLRYAVGGVFVEVRELSAAEVAELVGDVGDQLQLGGANAVAR